MLGWALLYLQGIVMIITDVESALIYEMKPFENTDKLNGYCYFNECKIINTGYRGVLPSVICMEDQV